MRVIIILFVPSVKRMDPVFSKVSIFRHHEFSDARAEKVFDLSLFISIKNFGGWVIDSSPVKDTKSDGLNT